MRWIATNPESYDGQVVGSGQCVAYVERACGAPHTSQWKRGDLVKGSNVAQGTAIATFEPMALTATPRAGRTLRYSISRTRRAFSCGTNGSTTRSHRG
jgi:hypothetical protein